MILYEQIKSSPTGLRQTINQSYRTHELDNVNELIQHAFLSEEMRHAIHARAVSLVETVRQKRINGVGLDAFLTEYTLSSEEGIALMCLAEALLRIPDKATTDQLIKDKLSQADWKSHKGQSDSFFINAATWALILTGKILNPEQAESLLSQALLKLMSKFSEGMIRPAAEKAMRIMGKQFVIGQTIQEALKTAKKQEAIGYRYSYDMLGEAAITEEDAERYFDAYFNAIEAIGKTLLDTSDLYKNPNVSVKLSALHPRYQETQVEKVLEKLPPKLLKLAQAAKKYNIGLTIDAEESERLDLSLDIIEQVFSDPSLDNWQGFGLAVQAYQKRAFYVLDWVAELARSRSRKMMVRLVKGAYWDSEIKKAQMLGLTDYPVFTRKVFTDVSYQACVKKLLTLTDVIYPQFATHNAYSVAMILELVGDYRDFEFQCLYGMGSELYEQIVPAQALGLPCRIYAPVGTYEDLLPYLARRLLENGANSSFVNQIVNEKIPVEALIEDPLTTANLFLPKINQNIPLPKSIFGAERVNSTGFDFSDRQACVELQKTLNNLSKQTWEAKPLIPKHKLKNASSKPVFSPQNKTQIGSVIEAAHQDIEAALTQAEAAFQAWSTCPIIERANCLNRLADLFETHQSELLWLLNQEAGRTFFDAIAEIREAVDFCRYYAIRALELFKPISFEGYTGEQNTLSLHPRGIVLAISPWNFPMAIFTGQIVAALVTGNCVIAKPAEQTPLIADFVVRLMHQAGIPEAVIQCLPGDGETVGAQLTQDERIKAVLFTGSTTTAQRIHQTLAARKSDIIPLIAETGGQNAMIVDSSALLEQVVLDVLQSAFGSAGQRCSSLRVLYVQEDVFERCVSLLKGAMAELNVGDPVFLKTDIGPVIDEQALKNIENHVKKMKESHEIIYECPLSPACDKGIFMPPTAIKLDSITSLNNEVFGPVLHVISFKQNELDKVINEINSTGYGLTLGIHSRINQTINYIRERIHAGNCYVNRNMIGAVVGLQPFGGEGLSGTGPKAGGPFYLQRLCVERTFTVDTTASGGNASLMSMSD